MRSVYVYKKIVVFCFLFSSAMLYGQYYSGQRVFQKKFPPEVIDVSQDTYIQINNSEGDIIVAVEDIDSKTVIQHSYIVSNDSYKFKNIPIGSYTCKYMWTDKNGKKQYSKDNTVMEFKENEYGGYEITMEKTVNGNLTQSNIKEEDFFN